MRVLVTVGPPFRHVLTCFFQFRLTFLLCLPRTIPYLVLLALQDWFFILSVDIPSWVRVEGKLIYTPMRSDMDQQSVTVDQFTTTMASIQEALTNLRQEMDSQQSRQPIAQDKASHDSLLPPPPPPYQTAPQASPYLLQDQSEVVPPTVEHTTVSKDTHAHMDCIEQRIRQLRVFENLVVWDDLDSIPVVSLPAKLRMPGIERYMGVGCPHIHLQLYNIVMRAHRLDKSQMVTMFPLSLSGVTQHLFASLESS